MQSATNHLDLDFDVEQRDRYGRLLAYVYLEDGTFVNGWLVEKWLKEISAVFPPEFVEWVEEQRPKAT